jgi:hypothetical protein
VRRWAVVALAALLAPSTALAYSKTFSAGSLIIPAQQEYQSDSGMVSAYGLVYMLLYKNAARVDAGQAPITVYWVIEPTKQSHHRCWAPDDMLPSYSSFNDNDGCDVAIQSASGQPVALVNPHTNDAANVEKAPFGACKVSISTSGANMGDIVRDSSSCQPWDAGTTPDPNKFVIGPDKKVMKYSGGLWAIDATDRDAVLQMLATDDDLKPFHYNGSCANNGVNSGCHYVAIHSAKVQFLAPIARMMNVKPPLIALLGANAVTILKSYLDHAGLTGITNFEGPRARDPTTGAITEHGVIYDVLNPVTDFVSKAAAGDLAHGILNQPDPDDTSRTFYQVLWAPHWEITVQSTLPAAGSLGDDGSVSGQWGHGGDDALTNALKNIAHFASVGNGIFAECASLESFEGSYRENANTIECNTVPVCALNGDPNQTTAYACGAAATPACSSCYSCDVGTTVDPSSCSGEVQCVGSCPVGSTPGCSNKCFTCTAPLVPDTSNCNDVNCVLPNSACGAGYSHPVARTGGATCSGCFQCSSGTMVPPDTCSRTPECVTCETAYSDGPYGGYSPSLGRCVDCRTAGATWNEASQTCSAGTFRTDRPSRSAASTESFASASFTTTTTSPAVASDPTCPANYSLACPDVDFPVDLEGNEVTHFQVTNRLKKNGLGNSFNGPDCTDREPTVSNYHDSGTGDCIDFHPEAGGPGSPFSQKGNFNYNGTSGHVHQYKPPWEAASQYKANVFRIVTSSNSIDPDRDGWDFASARHKDGDPAQGMVVYLAGHSYAGDAGGHRLVLNTLLNLSFSAVGTELARSEPVGYANTAATPVTYRVYQGTYVQMPPPGPYQDWVSYTTDSRQSWRFPYTTGHLYEYEASAIEDSEQDFREHINWDAATRMPSPANRTIFTALGGSANLGWKKVNFSYEETEPGCVHDGTDERCDLSKALASCATAGVTLAALNVPTTTGNQRDTLGMFVQQVRGHCSAHNPTITGSPLFTPSDLECDDQTQPQRNRAKLGGLDHGSPAIVGLSRYVTGTPWTNRPVVAYAGARDGMLHAFYVSGGTDFGTVEGKALPAGVQAGQELWAFVPPGQICGLATNNAMVDASVNVIDVFGDFPYDRNNSGVIDWDLTGEDDSERPNGVRRWRTVLLAAAGEGGSELFALDVTNPLKPVLLWHVGGATDHDGKWDANRDGVFAGADDVMSTSTAASYALKWFDWDDGLPTAYSPTDYTVSDNIKFGRHDYRNLGKAYGTAIGKVWVGNAFQYVAYVATSAADYTDSVSPTGYKGVEMFAIDLVTGKKLWQWEHRYSRTNADGSVIADNTIPGRPALADTDADGSVDRIYVGDMEGHLWELAASDGRNMNFLPTTNPDGHRSFPLFGTANMTGTGASEATRALFEIDGESDLAQQPLTSPIGQGRFTDVEEDLVPYLKDRLAVVQGTMGVDWAIAPFEAGHVYVVPIAPDAGTRISSPVDLETSPDPLLFGVLMPDAKWDIALDVGERVFGMPRVVNNRVVFNTAFGSFTSDITDSLQDRGNYVEATKEGTDTTPNGTKSFGGVLIFDGRVIISTATSIKRLGTDESPPNGGVQQRPFNRSTPAIMKTWEPSNVTEP